VGKIGIIDNDQVDLSNLHRQLLHTNDDLGRPKIESAKEKLLTINPEVKVTTYNERLSADNALDIVKGWDFVLDGSDNFPTKFLINDACVLANVPLSHGGVLRFTGMAMTILPGRGPCYRCLTPEAPPPGMIPTCQEAGVLGVVPGVIGTVQATEVLKYFLDLGGLLVGRVIFFDALEMRFEEFEIQRRPDCLVCGEKPVIKDLSQVDYGHVCEVRF
jgi:adenylyltransferase/sulfurtransferase